MVPQFVMHTKPQSSSFSIFTRCFVPQHDRSKVEPWHALLLCHPLILCHPEARRTLWCRNLLCIPNHSLLHFRSSQGASFLSMTDQKWRCGMRRDSVILLYSVILRHEGPYGAAICYAYQTTVFFIFDLHKVLRSSA